MGLVGWNDKTEVAPMAAKELPKISADGKVYTFTLREGIKFHNGREVTADDVKYSLTRALDPSSPRPWQGATWMIFRGPKTSLLESNGAHRRESH